MDFLKALFESGALTWEQFCKAVEAKGYKLADLSTGNYVAKGKFEDEVSKRDATISELNTQITNRDKDMKSLQKQLEDNGTDSETKIADLTTQLTKLQGDYKTAKSDYESKLSKQAYEFAVKEFASGQKFSSVAARRDFEREMISASLKMQDNSILGANDFAEKYKQSNSDAFIVEKAAEQNPKDSKPIFVQPTSTTPAPDENPFIKAFNFAGN